MTRECTSRFLANARQVALVLVLLAGGPVIVHQFFPFRQLMRLAREPENYVVALAIVMGSLMVSHVAVHRSLLRAAVLAAGLTVAVALAALVLPSSRVSGGGSMSGVVTDMVLASQASGEGFDALADLPPFLSVEFGHKWKTRIRGIGWPGPWIGEEIELPTDMEWYWKVTLLSNQPGTPAEIRLPVDLENVPPSLSHWVTNAPPPTAPKRYYEPRVAYYCGRYVVLLCLYPLWIVPLIVRLILRKRTFPPGHCQKCGYDLRGLPEPRCPECGRGFEPGEALAHAVACDRRHASIVSAKE